MLMAGFLRVAPNGIEVWLDELGLEAQLIQS